MRIARRLLAAAMCALAALAMCVGLAGTAWGEGGNGYTITIDNAHDGQTYTAYKVLDVTTNGNSYAYSLSSNRAAWYSVVDNFLNASNGDSTNADVYGLSLVDYTDGTGMIAFTATGITAENSDAFAKAFAEYLGSNIPQNETGTTGTVYDNSYSITVAEPGYYLVTSSLGTVRSIAVVTKATTIEEKNDEPTIAKTADKDNASIGDEITYTLTVAAGGAADTDYVVHDVMGAGLDLVGDASDAFTIKNGENTVDPKNYTVKVKTANGSETTDGCSFEITLNKGYVSTLGKGATVTISYKAKLNQGAYVGTEPTEKGDANYKKNLNTAHLIYGGGRSTDQSVYVATYSFDLVKTDSQNKVIDGATFKLYREKTGNGETTKEYITLTGPSADSTTYTVSGVTDSDADATIITAGNVTISGLGNDDTYHLEEIAAPSGYNKLTGPVLVKLNGAEVAVNGAADTKATATVSDGTYTEGGVQVVNNTGTKLPSTGGMGTMVIYVAGGLLVAAAVVLLVAKKKMSANGK